MIGRREVKLKDDKLLQSPRLRHYNSHFFCIAVLLCLTLREALCILWNLTCARNTDDVAEASCPQSHRWGLAYSEFWVNPGWFKSLLFFTTLCWLPREMGMLLQFLFPSSASLPLYQSIQSFFVRSFTLIKDTKANVRRQVLCHHISLCNQSQQRACSSLAHFVV